MSPKSIEFWFEFASNYSYLSLMRIEQQAARLGVTIEWRPFCIQLARDAHLIDTVISFSRSVQ